MDIVDAITIFADVVIIAVDIAVIITILKNRRDRKK